MIISLSLMLAGAIGNMIDSAFYGMIFNNSNYFEVARLFPTEGGYTSFLHGKVVDMFYFPILQGIYPTWLPYLGGTEYIFFRPVFNIADSSITIGVLLMIFFQKQFLRSRLLPLRHQGTKVHKGFIWQADLKRRRSVKKDN